MVSSCRSCLSNSPSDKGLSGVFMIVGPYYFLYKGLLCCFVFIWIFTFYFFTFDEACSSISSTLFCLIAFNKSGKPFSGLHIIYYSHFKYFGIIFLLIFEVVLILLKYRFLFRNNATMIYKNLRFFLFYILI